MFPARTEQQPRNDAAGEVRLARRLGLFDATMIVMGGIIGSGIFINPSVVARQVHTPALILGAWLVGGLVAIAGAFIYAELASVRPSTGGQYAYLRDAFHPSVAFLYGWALLLVTQTGGMAAVAVTFSRYLIELTGAGLPDALLAALVLALLTAVNCLGVRAGTSVQNGLMLLKMAAIALLVGGGLLWGERTPDISEAPLLDRPVSLDLLTSFGAGMTPVMFAYGGWQTASFVAGEMRRPRRDLSRGLLIGVGLVVLVYLSVNLVCLSVLGTRGLAATGTPASNVMRLALGERGAQLIAVGITISTLGFLSQGMLTAPRVYFAMAEDGLFFRRVARVSQRTRVPVAAIALQGALAAVIALSGRYEQILNYVVSVDFIWFGLTALCVFVFRRRQSESAKMTSESEKARSEGEKTKSKSEKATSEGEKATSGSLNTTSKSEQATSLSVKATSVSAATAADESPMAMGDEGGGERVARVPFHPWTTGFFVLACALVVASTIYKYPANSAVGLLMVAAGVPVYFFWQRRRRTA